MLLYGLCCKNRVELYMHVEISANVCGEGERETKTKHEKVGGPLCRISCQLYWPPNSPTLSLSLVPSVNCTC